MTPDFESKFREWFNLVSGHDPQHYQDLEWEWEEQIDLFLKNPDKCLSEEIKWKKRDDEYMQQEKEKDEYFTNCFGIRMKRQKDVTREEKKKDE